MALKMLTIDEVLAKYPGFTRPGLATLRHRGGGPRFYKPGRKTVLYSEEEFEAWLVENAYTRTQERVAS